MRRRVLKAIHGFRRLYWRVARPRTRGSRAIVVDQHGNVALVRHSYQHELYLPGGGVRRTESFEDAICRELREELGVVPKDLDLLGVYLNTFEGKRDRVAVFVVRRWEGNPEPRTKEISEVVWVDPGSLPADTSRGSRRRIEEHIGGVAIDDRW